MCCLVHTQLPTTHTYTRHSSLCCPLSGSPCRLPPGSTGQCSAGVYILHPGHLCVCGSALHPKQRAEVHHLWHLSAPCLWVSLFLCLLFNLLNHSPSSSMSTSASFQACASWLQPPSTQTASTETRATAGTRTATSWRGSPSLLHSSPPSLTSCYARRLETRASSNQPRPDLRFQLKSALAHRYCVVYICLFRASDLSCLCRFSCRYSRPVDPLKYTLMFDWACCHGFTLCGKFQMFLERKASSINHKCIWVYFKHRLWAAFSRASKD